MKKKIIIICAIVVGILLVGYLIPLKLVKQHDRTSNYVILTSSEKLYLQREAKKLKTAEDVMRFSLKRTASHFTFSKVNDTPNNKANCIGYAEYCAKTCNYLAGITDCNIKCKPVVGYVTYGGINICRFLQLIVSKRNKGFVKDHDFCEFTIEGSTIYADPSLLDILGKSCMTK